MYNFLRHETRTRRGTIIGWAVGLSAFVAIYSSAFPTLPPEVTQSDIGSIDMYRALGLSDMATFSGYFTSVILNYLTVLLGIYAIAVGTAALGGEDDSGVLELWVTLPLSRWRLVLAKALGLGLITLVILVIVAVATIGAFAAIQTQVETSVTIGEIFLLTLNTWPLTMAFAMLGLFLGAYLPTRRSAIVLSAVILVASFFGNNMAPLVEPLEPLQPLFPFYHYHASVTAIIGGKLAGNVLVLLGIVVALLLLAILAFQHRNVTVGAWPWQRAQVAE